MKIFFGRALTCVPEELRSAYAEAISRTQALLVAQGIDVFSANTTVVAPQKFRNETEYVDHCKSVYALYKNEIGKSDLVIADVTFPSVGVGIELQIASLEEKPIVIVGHREFKSLGMYGAVSKIALGLPHVCRYIDLDLASVNFPELLEAVERAFKR